MGIDAATPALCRDCDAELPATATRCGACGGARRLAHPELHQLSIAHVDCDAFFAAIEKRDDPSLVNKPVIVGGGQRGVVSTCCYIARSYGVRSAMPMFKALELCPGAVVRKSRFDAYQTAARGIRDAMEAITPLVQPLSIDEAFLDLTGTERLHRASPAQVLCRLARQIEADIGITVSVGLSHNKFLAKLASDLDKPRGFSIIGEAETLSRLAPMPTRAIFGVGAAMEERLRRAGFTTLGDLQAADPSDLGKTFGENGLRLAQLARGQDGRVVSPSRAAKSISAETTFGTDLSDRKALADTIYRLAQKVARRAKAKGLAGRVVTLKLKTAAFRSFTRRRTLSPATNLAHLIHETGAMLLADVEPGQTTRTPYRLIGIGLSDLVPASDAADDLLFAEDHRRIRQREDAVDALRDRFGDGVIGTLRETGKTYPND